MEFKDPIAVFLTLWRIPPTDPNHNRYKEVIKETLNPLIEHPGHPVLIWNKEVEKVSHAPSRLSERERWNVWLAMVPHNPKISLTLEEKEVHIQVVGERWNQALEGRLMRIRKATHRPESLLVMGKILETSPMRTAGHLPEEWGCSVGTDEIVHFMRMHPDAAAAIKRAVQGHNALCAALQVALANQ